MTRQLPAQLVKTGFFLFASVVRRRFCATPSFDETVFCLVFPFSLDCSWLTDRIAKCYCHKGSKLKKLKLSRRITASWGEIHPTRPPDPLILTSRTRQECRAFTLQDLNCGTLIGSIGATLLSNIRYIDSGVISPWGSAAPHLQRCSERSTVWLINHHSNFPFILFVLCVTASCVWLKKKKKKAFCFFLFFFLTWKTPWRRSHSRVAQRCRHTPHWLKLLLMCRSLNRQKNNIRIKIYTKIYMNKQTYMHMF